ncbi:hypothetical protein CerSpe_239220 [Prunus speciosa]
MDKFMLYMLTAGKKALADGGITEDVMEQIDKAKCGVLIGSAMGGMKVTSVLCGLTLSTKNWLARASTDISSIYVLEIALPTSVEDCSVDVGGGLLCRCQSSGEWVWLSHLHLRTHNHCKPIRAPFPFDFFPTALKVQTSSPHKFIAPSPKISTLNRTTHRWIQDLNKMGLFGGWGLMGLVA